MYERVQQFAPKFKLRLKKKFFILDSTTIPLCLKMFPWARFRKNKAAVKLSTLLDAKGALPRFVNVTKGKTQDNKASKDIPIPNDSYLVMDKAYLGLKQPNLYNHNQICFINRMRSDMSMKIEKSNPVKKGGPVRSDQLVTLLVPRSHSLYPNPLRRIRYYDTDKKREFVFLTNDFHLSAQTVANIYKSSWDIELFFKTIKQNLKIKRFMVYRPNAVRIQVFTAMITYLLISLIKFLQKSAWSIQKIFRLIRTNLFERKDISTPFTGVFKDPLLIKNVSLLALFKV
jgi:putative transposase